jgi:hypothetical protein
MRNVRDKPCTENKTHSLLIFFLFLFFGRPQFFRKLSHVKPDGKHNQGRYNVKLGCLKFKTVTCGTIHNITGSRRHILLYDFYHHFIDFINCQDTL